MAKKRTIRTIPQSRTPMRELEPRARAQSFDDAVLFAATNQYLDARRESQKLLRAGGVFVEDCLSQELPAAITSRYFAIKRAGIL